MICICKMRPECETGELNELEKERGETRNRPTGKSKGASTPGCQIESIVLDLDADIEELSAEDKLMMKCFPDLF